MDWSFGDGPLSMAARGLSDLGMLLLFGVCLFNAMTAPHALARAPAAVAMASSRRLWRVSLAAAGASAAAILFWLLVQSAAMADASGPAGVAHAVGLVVTGTQFGQISAVELLVVLVTFAVLCARRWPWLACGLAGLAMAVHAGHGHASSREGLLSLGTSVEVVHLLAAGAWLGALPLLLMMTLRDPPRTAAAAARCFSTPGKVYVVAVAATAVIQGWELIGSVPGLTGTSYGWMAMVKIALLAVLIGYALTNRYRFAPALLGADPAVARRQLLRSLTLQTGFGVAVIAAAALLSSLSPAIQDQPVSTTL
jgi:putative copper resistance protein D